MNCLPDFITALLFPYDTIQKENKVKYYPAASKNYECEKLCADQKD